MMNKEYSEPTEFYKGILSKMLSYDFPGKGTIAEQLRLAKVRTMPEPNAYDSIKFSVPTESSPELTEKMPIELQAYDDDGVPISVLLFVTDGKVDFLEFSKADGASINKMPSPDEFQRPNWRQVDDVTWTQD